MTHEPKIGETVAVPWGLDVVRGTVAQVYGPPTRRHVIVELTPELSGYVVDVTTTVSIPLSAVEVSAAA